MYSDSSSDMDDECRQPTELCPELLGLVRINKINIPKTTDSSTSGKDELNSRSMSTRIRKKNKLFYDEKIFNTSKNPSVKQERMTYVNSPKTNGLKKIMKSKFKPKTPETPKQEKIINQNVGTPKIAIKPITPKMKLKTQNLKTPEKRASIKSTENGIYKPKTPKTSKQEKIMNQKVGTPKTAIKPITPSIKPKTQNLKTSEKSIKSAKNGITKQKPSIVESLKTAMIASKQKSGSIKHFRYLHFGLKLRSMLKLPKANNFVYYEWFYSDIDKPLLYESDFMMCVKELFPSLNIKTMTRIEWCLLRRMMGKPRRCSQNFFDEEIRELNERRKTIRLLQQRIAKDGVLFDDIPNEIPLQLTIGTRVTAKLMMSIGIGLFDGTIEALDVSNYTYRIHFDKPGLGTLSVPDYEVCSHEPSETISKNGLLQLFGPRVPYRTQLISSKAKIYAGETNSNTVAQYRMKLLENALKFRKILTTKQQYVQTLCDMNSEAERMISCNEDITCKFQSCYAKIVLNLDNLNHDLTSVMCVLSEEIKEIAPEEAEIWPLITDYLQNLSFDEAEQMIEHNKEVTDSSFNEEDQPMLALTKHLLGLMLQVKTLSERKPTAYELDALKRTMTEIKCKLTESNQEVFENCVEIHMQQIQSTLDSYHTSSPKGK